MKLNSFSLRAVNILLVCFALSAPARSAAADRPPVAVIRVPDGGVHPQVQTDSRGRVHIIYFKGDARHGDVFYARSDDGCKTFTQPLQVNSQPGSALIIGTIRGPHLAIGKGDRVHVAWMGSDQARPKVMGKNAPMLYTRLNEAGDAFEPQRNLIEAHPGLDGGGSVAADRDGNVYVAWHAPDTGEGEENRQVWLARSKDDGKTFGRETAALPQKTGVCGCCGLDIAAADKGVVVIVFRSATAMVNRDVHVLVSKDFGSTFHIAAVDPFRIGTCVMSTASIATFKNRIISAWETKEQIRVGVLDTETGQASEPASVAGPGKGRKHPSVAVNSQGAYVVAWTEGTGWNKGGTVAWQVFDPSGALVAGSGGHVEGLPAWSVPAAYVSPSGEFRIVY